MVKSGDQAEIFGFFLRTRVVFSEQRPKKNQSAQNKIKSVDIVEKKQILADYFKKSGVLNKANDLLGNYEKKCGEVVISLPEDIQKDIELLLDLIIKRNR